MGPATATYIYLAGDSAQFTAAMDEAATSAEGASDRIEGSLSGAGSSASAVADDIADSFSGAAADISSSISGAADDAGTAVEGAAARIGEALSDTNADAGATAADISASLDTAADGIASSFSAAAVKVDASLDSITSSAAATASDVTASSAVSADAMSASAAAGGDEMVESLGAAGVAAGAAARDGVASESEGIADDLGNAGEDAGAALTEGVTTSTADMAEQLGGAGILAGSKLESGVSEGAAGAADDLATAGEEGGAELAAGVGAGAEKSGSFLTNVGKWGALAGVAIAGVGVKMAMDWQSSMTSLVTGAGQAKSGLAVVSSGLLAMAGKVAMSTKTLATGMYLVESAGYHGAAGLKVLQAAAEGARVGATTLSSVANVVTSALNAYGLSAQTATSVTNELVATVASGKMHMATLATAVANVLPVAASAHVSFSQVGGAIATMTAQGMTARRASMGLANMLRAMIAPSSKASDEMRTLGLTANHMAEDIGENGLTGTLDQMTEAILKNSKGGMVMATGFAEMSTKAKAVAEAILSGKESVTQINTAMTALTPVQQKMVSNFEAQATSATGVKQTFDSAMKTMVGGATGLNVALLLSGTHSATFAKNVASVGTAAASASKTVKGFSTVQQDLGYKLDSVKDSAEALMIEFGQDLLPALTSLLGAVQTVGMPVLGGLFDLIERGTEFVEDLFHWFEEGEPIVTGLAGAIGGMLLPVLATSIINAGLSAGAQVASWATTAAASVKGAATAQTSWITVSRAATSSAASTEESGGIISRVVSRLGNALFPELAEKVSSATQSINSDVSSMGTAAQTTSGRVGEATGSIDNDLRHLTTTTGAATEAFDGEMTEMGGSAVKASVEVEGAMDNVDRSFAATTDDASATEGAMSISMGGMLGPIGLVAGAVGGLAGVFLGLFHHTTAAAKSLANQIKNVNQSLRQMTTSTVAGLDGYMLKLTQQTEKYEQRLRSLTPGSKSFTEIINEIKTLTEKWIEATRGADNLQTNITVLSHAFGISKTQAEAVARTISMTLHAALTTRQVKLFGSRLTSTATIPLAKVAAASKVSTATLIATAKRRVATLEAATAKYSQYAKTALSERVALTQKTSAAATAALVNVTQDGLPKFEAIMSQFGVSIPKNTLGELTQAMTKTGYVSVTKLAHSIQRGHQLVVNAARGEIVTPITDSLTDVKKRMAKTGKKAVTVYVGVFTDAKGQFVAGGATLPAGITQGILAGKASVDTAVAQLVNSAYAAAQKASESHSPSLLFAKVGKSWGQGMGVGLTGEEGAVGAAIKTLVKKSLTTANAAGFAAAEEFGKSIAASAATSFVKAFTVKAANAGFAAAHAWEKTLATKAKMAGLAAATAFNAAFTSKANKAGFAAATAFEKTLASKAAAAAAKAAAAAAAAAAKARTAATVGVNASVYTARSQLTADKGVLGATTIAAYQKMLTSAVKSKTKTKISSATTAITNAVETMLGNLSSQYAKSFSTGLQKTLYKTIEALSGEKATLGSTYLTFASQLEAALKSGSAANVTSTLAAINKAATAKIHPATTATTTAAAATAAAAATTAAVAATTGTTTGRTASQFATALLKANAALTKATAGIVAFTGAIVQATTAVQNFTVHVNVAANMNLSTPGEAEKVGTLLATGVRNKLISDKRSLGGAIRTPTGLGLA